MSERHDVRPELEVKLPSLGRAYQGQIPEGIMKVYALRTVDEKLLTGANKALDFENIVDTLLRRCTNLPEKMRPGTLYTGDRVFLLMMLRCVSYGANYTFKLTCPDCRASWSHTIDLTRDLEIREAAPDHQDPFTLDLPHSGDVIKLRLFRGDDEKAVFKFVDQSSKKVDLKQVGDPGYLYRMILHVVGVESVMDPEKSFDADTMTEPGQLFQAAQYYMESLTALDSVAIRDAIEDRTPGIILRLEPECPKCSLNFETAMPMEASFFRPRNTTGPRTQTRVVSHTTR